MIIYPDKTDGIVYEAGNSLFGYNGWPSVTKDEKGTLYAVFSGHRIYHVCPFGQTYMCTSDDDGKTWSIPYIINDTPLDDRDAGIVYLGNGRLLVTWFVEPAWVVEEELKGETGTENPDHAVVKAGLWNMEQYCDNLSLGGSFIRISDDYGKTWGQTIRIPVSTPHGPTVLNDGSLLYVGRDMYTDCLKQPVVAAYKSLDRGDTWTYYATLCSASIKEGEHKGFVQYHEPSAIQLPNGTIIAAIRREPCERGGYFGVDICKSYDEGKTWTEPISTFAGSPPHLLLHSSGVLLCAVGMRRAPFGQKVYASYDGGETWSDEYVLRDDAFNDDLGYPCSVELQDGSIFTVYYQPKIAEANVKPSVLYTKWKLK